MIAKVFDNGWGNDHGAKQFERSLVDSLLLPLASSQCRTVLINSVWYTEEFNQQVLEWCSAHHFDHVVLAAMLDPAIPSPDQFDQLQRPITALGYYPGPGHLDFWALFVDRFFDMPPLADLLHRDDLEVPFMCLNRKPHWHRRQLFESLARQGVLDHGMVSLGGDTGQAERVLALDRGHSDLAPNAGTEQHGIANDIASLGHISNWRRCFLNIVTETVFDINRHYFVSEKIYKPIVGCRPFLVYDPDGAETWLRTRGFQTYLDDFSDISDLDLRMPYNMAPFVKSLCDQPRSYFRKKIIDLRDKILYNKHQFSIHVENNKHLVQKGITCPI